MRRHLQRGKGWLRPQREGMEGGHRRKWPGREGPPGGGGGRPTRRESLEPTLQSLCPAEEVEYFL